MAEAFFNRLARGKAVAVSAGMQPADAVNPTVVAAMREEGIDVSHNKPKLLTQEMLERAERVITMGCSVDGICPATFVETEDWGLEDPKGKPIEKVREIRDEIKKQVAKLLNELDPGHSTTIQST